MKKIIKSTLEFLKFVLALIVLIGLGVCIILGVFATPLYIIWEVAKKNSDRLYSWTDEISMPEGMEDHGE